MCAHDYVGLRIVICGNGCDWYELSTKTSPRAVQSDWITAMVRLEVVSPGRNSNFNLPRVVVVVLLIPSQHDCLSFTCETSLVMTWLCVTMTDYV